MALDLSTRTLPLRIDSDHVIRVAGTRIPLERVVVAFQSGATPEQIAQQYPTLPLRDIYAVIAFYLDRTEAVDAYVAEREALAADVRADNDSRSPVSGIRARLLERTRE